MAADPDVKIPDAVDLDVELDGLSRAELIALLKAQREAGVRISFDGKSNARRLARKVRPRVERVIKKYSVGTPEAQANNLLIEGDNLQALVTLYRERGQVDLILTDPPYNTGNDFRYNDKWEEDPNDPDLGEFVREDDGDRHTKWMRFMWPRLQMMKAMLRPSGVLAICIDYRELFHLGQMLDELFGDKNRLAIINWQKSYSPRGDNTHVSTATEYVLVYAKDEERAKTQLLPRTEAMDARYKNRDGDPRLWKGGDAGGPKAKTHQGMVYAIQSPFTGEFHYPPSGACWRPEQRLVLDYLGGWDVEYELKDLDDADERAKIIGLPVEDIRQNVKGVVLKTPLPEAKKRATGVLENEVWPRLFFGLKGEGRPQLKFYLEDVKQGKVPTTFWADEDYSDPEALGPVSWAHEISGHSQTGISELDAIVGKGHGFETVKPLKLFSKIIQIWSPPSGVVLDPFAGSGTTGHAVTMLNEDTETDRRFVLVEQGRPERGDSYARTLMADRMSRVVTGDWKNGKGKPMAGGFRFVALDKKVDAGALLRMERDEMVDTVIASYFDSVQRRGQGLVTLNGADYKYLVARNSEDEGFFLVWDGADKNTDFDEDVYEVCASEAAAAGLKSFYHVYARFNLYQTKNVRFYQIPDRILADFGLDTRSEPFSEDFE